MNSPVFLLLYKISQFFRPNLVFFKTKVKSIAIKSFEKMSFKCLLKNAKFTGNCNYKYNAKEKVY